MKRQSLWAQRFSEKLDIAGESLPRQTIVELCADRRVLIENHNGVTDYGPERICVRVRFGQVIVMGSQLRLCRMHTHQLVITGKVQNIQIERGAV